jgi:hypothetical protein
LGHFQVPEAYFSASPRLTMPGRKEKVL